MPFFSEFEEEQKNRDLIRYYCKSCSEKVKVPQISLPESPEFFTTEKTTERICILDEIVNRGNFEASEDSERIKLRNFIEGFIRKIKLENVSEAGISAKDAEMKS